jgi:phosphate transport system permease protein
MSTTDLGLRGSVPLELLRPSGRRRAADLAARGAVYLCFLLALIPLSLIIFEVVRKGLKVVLDADFFSHSMAFITPNEEGGGAYHAIIGTLEQVGLAVLMSVPLGLLVAIYVTEYGKGWLRTAIRFFVDVMTGIPSIVAGLFIYTFWVVGLDRGFSGLAGAFALAVIMLPIVIRSSEEMLLLVPGALREASYALGIQRWRTTLRVVLPTASAGITTGVMLAVARVTGETAPLILTVFDNPYINTDPFHGTQAALPLFVYNQSKSAYDQAIQRAWGGALALIFIVMFLYIGARVITRRNTLAP